MIDILLKESSGITDLSARVKAPLIAEEQLDLTLDSGTLNYLITEGDLKGLNEALAGYRIAGGAETLDFVGMDSRALLRRETSGTGIYVHQVALTEPSKLLQGEMTEGFGVTQPENMYIEERKIVSSGKIMSYKTGDKYTHLAQGSEDINAPVHSCSIEGDGLILGAVLTVYAEDEVIYWSATWQNDIESYEVPYNAVITCLVGNGDTLLEVVTRFLLVAGTDDNRFMLTDDPKVVNALAAVLSPEFQWNTQTTFWECLQLIGGIVDAIPRLVADTDGNYTIVTFDFVNAYIAEVTSLTDGGTNAYGENIDENQYNTALRSVVENLRESEK